MFFFECLKSWPGTRAKPNYSIKLSWLAVFEVLELTPAKGIWAEWEHIAGRCGYRETHRYKPIPSPETAMVFWLLACANGPLLRMVRLRMFLFYNGGQVIHLQWKAYFGICNCVFSWASHVQYHRLLQCWAVATATAPSQLHNHKGNKWDSNGVLCCSARVCGRLGGFKCIFSLWYFQLTIMLLELSLIIS